MDTGTVTIRESDSLPRRMDTGPWGSSCLTRHDVPFLGPCVDENISVSREWTLLWLFANHNVLGVHHVLLSMMGPVLGHVRR